MSGATVVRTTMMTKKLVGLLAPMLGPDSVLPDYPSGRRGTELFASRQSTIQDVATK